MKIKFLTLILCAAGILTSCDDFTSKNLDVAQPTNEEIDNVDLLLSENSTINSGAFSLEKLIANTGSFVTGPLVEELAKETKELDQAINQHCSTLNILSDLDEDKLETLRAPIQENWKEAMSVYHKLAMMNYGPAAAITSTAMDSIYSFDGIEKCRMDVILLQIDLTGESRLPRFDVINNYNVRGLDTLEPLFFAPANKSRCSRVNGRLTQWFQKPLLAREKQVCILAKHLSQDITAKASELQKAWSPQQGYYTAQMLRGAQGTPIELTNKISQALFFLDTNTKDIKLSYPAGFDVRVGDTLTKCPDASCPGSREHPYAEFGLEALESSLFGFKLLFEGISAQAGTNGLGFDDLLRDREHSDLAKNISTNLDLILENVRSLKKTTTLKEALENIDPTKCEQTTSENRLEEVCALVWDIRKVTDLLKNDYLNALQELSAPRQAQGDND